MIPFLAIGPAADYPTEAQVEAGVDYDFGNFTGEFTGGGDALESTSQQLLALLQEMPTTIDDALEAYRTNGVASTNDMAVCMADAEQAVVLIDDTRDRVIALPSAADNAEAVDAELTTQHGDGPWLTGGVGPSGFTAVVVARLPIGSTQGWPNELTIGDAYLATTATSLILFVKDIDDNILAAMGSKTFADADFVGTLRLSPLTDGTRELDSPPTTIQVTSEDDPGILFNDDTTDAEFFHLQIPRSKTLLGVTKTRYSVQFILNWGDDETFERTIHLGETKFLRKNAPLA